MENKKKAYFAIPVFAVLLVIGAFSVPLSTDQITKTTVIDQQQMIGYVTIQLIDKETGIVIQEIKNHNLIVDVGLDEEAQAIFGVGGVGSTFFNFLDIGESATATPIGGCARVQDLSPDTVSPTGEISISIISQFDGSSCAGSIVETGIFNSLTGGQLLGRSTFGVITLTATDLLNVNYTVTLT